MVKCLCGKRFRPSKNYTGKDPKCKRCRTIVKGRLTISALSFPGNACIFCKKHKCQNCKKAYRIEYQEEIKISDGILPSFLLDIVGEYFNNISMKFDNENTNGPLEVLPPTLTSVTFGEDFQKLSPSILPPGLRTLKISSFLYHKMKNLGSLPNGPEIITFNEDLEELLDLHNRLPWFSRGYLDSLLNGPYTTTSDEDLEEFV